MIHPGLWQIRHAEKGWYRWLVFATAVTGTFMVNVDSSVMNVALPVLEREFHAGPQVLQWVISAYLLVITGILPIVGSLSDRLNRKRVFITGVVIFTGGSILCAFSDSIEQLILFRVVQSIGGSIIMGNVMSIVSYIFPSRQRGRPLGLVGSVVAAGTIVGPSIGGLLIAAYGWRSIFWVNVPIGVLSVVASVFVMMPIRSDKPARKFDVIGSILFFVGIVSLMLFVSEGQTWGWMTLRSLGTFLLSAIMLSAFVWQEVTSKSPVIELSLFRLPRFVLGNLTGFLSYVMMMFPSFLLPLYMHDVLRIQTVHIGLLLTPQAISMILFSPVGGFLADRIGTSWPAAIGLFFGTLGLILMAFLDATSSYTDIVVALSVFGLGMGLFTSPNNVSVLESVPIEKSGLTGSLIATVRNFGRVAGVSVTVLFLQLSGNDLQSSDGFAHASSFAFRMGVIIGIIGTVLTVTRFLVHAKKWSVAHEPSR
ncbi:MFS transporter [Ferroacidibacillus organovorans]|uniref:Multidrug MFS transporter n=1 Tax=Ferroacidibacillus organovorans TaxID=1765683 RepID=A0A101XPQ9_9BACL|nr:MFS transporter [Ferroacidibacillus organovorans]KUO95323.1 multidrug MFS transporter [Ferroacidibacillus organovorans]